MKKKMKTVMFLNNKGGVGKTASVTTIAHMLATKFNKKVLLIDLDPQMNSTCMFSNIDFIELFLQVYNGTYLKSSKSIEDLLIDRESDIHECIQSTDYENLNIIPSYLTLSEAEDLIRADGKCIPQFRLMKHLKKIEAEYDFCIIDGSPSVSIVNINGLVAADEVYIPLRCDGGSLLGVAITMNLIETVQEYAPDLKIGGMFFTQWNGRKNVSKTVYEIVQEMFGEYLLPYTISVSKNLEESTWAQVPLLAYDTAKEKNRATNDYLELTKYVMTK